ncbi:MAG: CarD family transcriptional regulator [Clostridia bacterium]|nr:CarD family transcriptional regulator [Lachnospiraceae bacterium]NCC00839.1 CarD family transcriptional regulator [Clostridia bacterium]NCD02069.1 CarD family transcriptional regulator [Clostridia bacterium]
MFQVNDMVLYGSNGVCELVDIDERDCGGKLVKYYILKPIYASNSTVFVPVNNPKLTSKMRHVLTKEEITQMIHSIPDSDREWITDERTRKEKFRDIVSRADTYELIQLIEALLKHQKEAVERGKKLHIADERMLREAEKMICDEFAYVLGIAQEDVPNYIDNSIQEHI